MNKDILFFIFSGNEAKSFRAVEPLYGTVYSLAHALPRLDWLIIVIRGLRHTFSDVACSSRPGLKLLYPLPLFLQRFQSVLLSLEFSLLFGNDCRRRFIYEGLIAQLVSQTAYIGLQFVNFAVES